MHFPESPLVHVTKQRASSEDRNAHIQLLEMFPKLRFLIGIPFKNQVQVAVLRTRGLFPLRDVQPPTLPETPTW